MWTYISDLERRDIGSISTFWQTHVQTCAPCLHKATAVCGSGTSRTRDAAGSRERTSLPILDR
ncbi:hypothetical protein SVAN01_04149 [Stagonosporopsis vannaccii]|nr:hypothetical protein SVAN01_04149 [Stagonosporopsis vannaccii]